MKLNTFAMCALVTLVFCACSTPKNITYFQDLNDKSSIQTLEAKVVTLQPLDQISIIVNSREPSISAMFNMPYYTRRIGDTQSLTANNSVASSTSSQYISGYTVDSKGEIDFPIIGKIKVAGMTREAVAADIKARLIASNQIKDPVVTIEYMNLGVTVMGEVARPGRYKIDRDRFTVMDALGLAGDLTINGERKNITVLRHTLGTADEVIRLDLTSGYSLYSSPGFYIQQGDIIYVSPNDKRQRESTVNGNNLRTSSFWISLASLLTSVAVLIFK